VEPAHASAGRRRSATIRRALIAVDADALDRVIGDWLRACTACDQGGWQIAMDGKDLHLRHEVARCEWMTLRRPGRIR
jgi:hypothetical protein